MSDDDFVEHAYYGRIHEWKQMLQQGKDINWSRLLTVLPAQMRLYKLIGDFFDMCILDDSPLGGNLPAVPTPTPLTLFFAAAVAVRCGAACV